MYLTIWLAALVFGLLVVKINDWKWFGPLLIVGLFLALGYTFIGAP